MLQTLTIPELCLGLFALCALFAAARDVTSYKIDNEIPLLIAVLFIPFAILNPVSWTFHAITALGIFLAGFICFQRGWLGAGDVKFLSATALWAGPALILEFLTITTLAGGVLSLVWLTRSYAFLLFPSSRKVLATPRGAPLPYGVAITFGALFVIWQLAAL